MAQIKLFSHTHGLKLVFYLVSQRGHNLQIHLCCEYLPKQQQSIASAKDTAHPFSILKNQTIPHCGEKCQKFQDKYEQRKE